MTRVSALRVGNWVIQQCGTMTRGRLEKIVACLERYWEEKYGERLLDEELVIGEYGKRVLSIEQAYGNMMSQNADMFFAFDEKTIACWDIPALEPADIGSGRYQDLVAELDRLAKLPTWQLMEISKK